MKNSASTAADDIRRVLLGNASAQHTAEVQRFFKDEIQSHGWYTEDLRKLALRTRKAILEDNDLAFLVAVADKLFRGRVLEEKIVGIFLLQGLTKKFGDAGFELFTSWIDRISTWADHDGLASYLLGPMIAEDTTRARVVFVWAKSRNRWHRRVAAVSLIRAIREKKCFREVVQISNLLLSDEDDMVQKGLGWLLREATKHDPGRTSLYLTKIKAKAPRLVMRTACEILSPAARAAILGPAKK